MQVHIAKVDAVIFSGEAASITAPGAEGEVTILQNHVPLVTPLKGGRITVRTGEGQHEFEVAGGVLEVSKEGATVLL